MILRAASTSLCGNTLIVALLRRAAVDDAGVIQLVGDDHVVLGEHGGDGAGVGGEAALKDDDGFDVLERRRAAARAPCAFPWFPEMVRTAPEPTPYFSTASSAAFTQLRMRRQAEIVVRRQVDHRLVVEGGVRLRACLRGRAACDTGPAASATSSSVPRKDERIVSHSRKFRVKQLQSNEEDIAIRETLELGCAVGLQPSLNRISVCGLRKRVS